MAPNALWLLVSRALFVAGTRVWLPNGTVEYAVPGTNYLSEVRKGITSSCNDVGKSERPEFFLIFARFCSFLLVFAHLCWIVQHLSSFELI